MRLLRKRDGVVEDGLVSRLLLALFSRSLRSSRSRAIDLASLLCSFSLPRTRVSTISLWLVFFFLSAIFFATFNLSRSGVIVSRRRVPDCRAPLPYLVSRWAVCARQVLQNFLTPRLSGFFFFFFQLL